MSLCTVVKQYDYKDHTITVLLISFKQGIPHHYCGYTNTYKDHPAHNTKYSYDWDIDVHGGVTFEDKLIQDTNHEYHIGFDCAHLNDTIENCDLKYVMQQCESMVDQLEDYPEPVNQNSIILEQLSNISNRLDNLMKEAETLSSVIKDSIKRLKLASK